MFGKDSKKKELIASLGDIYHKIEKEHQISPGDFPNLAKMQVKLKKNVGRGASDRKLQMKLFLCAAVGTNLY